MVASVPLRLAFRRHCEKALPDLVVLSTAELPAGLPFEQIGVLQAPVMLAGRTWVRHPGAHPGTSLYPREFWSRIWSAS